MDTSRSVLLIPLILGFICPPVVALHAKDVPNFQAFVFVSSAADTFEKGYEVKDKGWVIKDEKGCAIAIYGTPRRKEFVDIMKKFVGKQATLINMQSIRYELTLLYHKKDRALPYIYIPRQAMINGVVQFVIERPIKNSILPEAGNSTINKLGIPYIPPASGSRTSSPSSTNEPNTSTTTPGAPSVEPKTPYKPKLPKLK